MAIDLSPYHIPALASEDLVSGFNGALTALQSAMNDVETIADGAAALQISGITIVDYNFNAFPGEYPADPSTGDAYLVEIPGTIDGVEYTEGSLLLWSGVDWFYSMAQETREDGEWTPVLADAATGGNEATMTATAASQYYRKEGGKVTVWFDLSAIDTTGMTAGNGLFLIGLPFAADDDVTGVGSISVSDVTFTGQLSVRVDGGNQYAKIEDSASGSAADDLLVSALTSTSAAMRGTITYWV